MMRSLAEKSPDTAITGRGGHGLVLTRELCGTNPERMAPLKFAAHVQAACKGSKIKVTAERDIAKLNKDPIDVLVRLNGFADHIVRGITGKQVIELKPGLPVTLTSKGNLVAQGQKLQFELECLDDPIATQNPVVYSAAAGGPLPTYQRLLVTAEALSGTAKLRLPRPGRYRIAALQPGDDGARVELHVEPRELQIGADSGVFDVHLTVR